MCFVAIIVIGIVIVIKKGEGVLRFDKPFFSLKLGFLYCPFDITWKVVFRLAFYFKRKYFVLIDHI